MSTLLINTGTSEVIKEVDVLIPGTGGDVKTLPLTNNDPYPKLSPAGLIDVVHNFSWYAGPKASTTALDKLPCAFLIEREQKISSLISGGLYYLNASAKAIGNIASMFGRDTEDPTSLLGKLNIASKSASKGFGSVFKYTKEDTELLGRHNLKSLEGIYLTEPTEFKYRLPFFENTLGATNGWGESTSNGGDDSGNTPLKGLKLGKLGDIASGARRLIETATTLVNITQPGVYIEKPKYFSNAERGEEKTIKFPLLNTVRRSNQSPIQQNYELLWLLTFQNKPYKTSFGRTPPPKIYTVTVPGQFSMPYAYISKLQIDFLGTVRRMPVYLPVLQDEQITSQEVYTPIPEAYEVSITFNSLIGDYGNTMVSNAFNTSINNGRVTVGL